MNENHNVTTKRVGWIVQLYFPNTKRWENYSKPLEYAHAVYAMKRISDLQDRKVRLRKVVF